MIPRNHPLRSYFIKKKEKRKKKIILMLHTPMIAPDGAIIGEVNISRCNILTPTFENRKDKIT